MNKIFRVSLTLALAIGLVGQSHSARAAEKAKKPERDSTTALDISKPLNDLPPATPHSTPAEVSNAIQARLDYLHEHRLNGRVFIPAGQWQISRPVFMNGDNKELVGAGVGRTVLSAADGYLAMPMINAGARTEVELRPIQDVNRVLLVDPAARILDASVQGRRYGLRTYAEYPSRTFPAAAHHPAVKDPKPWVKGRSYKVDDVVDLRLPAAPGAALAVCVRDHEAAELDQPGRGKEWQQSWVIEVPAHVQVVGDPLANGAYDPDGRRASDWAGMGRFTLDFAFVQNVEAKAYSEARMLCGVVESDPDRPECRVWKLTLNSSGDLTFDLTLADGKSKSFVVGRHCQDMGTYRLAVQVDFATRSVQAWLAKPGTAEPTRTCDDRATLPERSGFRQVECGYFIIAGGDGGPAASNGRMIPPTDITVCGLHTSAALRYADSEKLLRRDDASITDDHFRYFTNDDGTVALLPLTDSPDDSPSETSKLLVTIQHGNGAGDARQKGYGLLKVPQQVYGIGRPRISDITLKPGPVWGVGILNWHTLDMQLTHVDIRGGFYAVGDLSHGAQYTLNVRDCMLSGSEAAFNGSSNIIYMKDVTIDPVGRYGMLLAGSSTVMEHVTFGDPRVHRSEYYFRDTGAVCYGGMNLLNDVHADAPAGSVYPSKAAFSMETIAYSRASLVMRDCSVANMGPKAAFVELPFVAFRSPGTLLLERCAYRGNPISAWVRTDSAWWAGQVREFDPVAPVAKYFVSNAPPFPVWGPGKKYHRNEHVLFSERGWEALDDHSADAASPPGSDAGGAHWRRAISTVVFEPMIPPQPPR